MTTKPIDMRGCTYPEPEAINFLHGFQAFISAEHRERSAEYDFGAHWKWIEPNATSAWSPSASLAWIEDTGELYAAFFDFDVPEPDRYIMIGIYPKEDQAEYALRDWADVFEHDLRALIVQARGGAKAPTYADVEGERDPLEAPFQRALNETQFRDLESVVDGEDRDLPFKIYRGDVLDGDCRIRVVENNISRLLSHYGHHSPNGFSWGYGGSGPAETALNILADYFGEHESLTLQAIRSSRKAWRKFRALRKTAEGYLLYQLFKEQVIAGFEQSQPWRFTENDVRAWLAQYPEIALDSCVQCGETIPDVKYHCSGCGDALCASCSSDSNNLCDECFDKQAGQDDVLPS